MKQERTKEHCGAELKIIQSQQSEIKKDTESESALLRVMPALLSMQ